MRFNRSWCNIVFLLASAFLVVALGIELSATRSSAGFGQPALDYHQVGYPGVEPRPSCSQSRRAPICTSTRLSCQSERQDLNLRSRGPRPRAITRLRYVLIFSAARTTLPAVAGSKRPTQRKNPLPCDTGLRLIPWWIDQVSQAQWQRGQRIRRLIIGKRPRPIWFAVGT